IVKHLEHAGLTPAYPKQDTFFARLPERQLQHDAATDRARLLGHVDILGDLTGDELQELARDVVPRFVHAGATLVSQGDQSASMFVLAEGLLEVWAEQEGGRVKLAQIKPGEFAGEMSLLTGEPRSATITAVTEALVYEVTREHLTPILDARPALFEKISQLV